MSRSNNIISFGDAAKEHRLVLDSKTLEVVDACRSVIVRTLPCLADGLFEKLDDALYELADKSETGSSQAGYFDAMREVRKQRSLLQNSFTQGIQERFDSFWRYGPIANRDKHDAETEVTNGFCLMEEDDLEESLAINDMISKGENRYERELYSIEQRFASMVKDEGVTHQNNPVAPAAICTCFEASIKCLEVEIPVKLVIYKLLDKHVMQQLDPMYKEIDAALERAGFMPLRLPRIQKTRHTLTPPRKEAADISQEVERPQNTAPQDSIRIEDCDAASTELFSTLQQLLNLRQQQGGVSIPTAEAAALPPVNASELLGALSFMQKVSVELLCVAPALGAAMVRDTDVKDVLLSKLKIGQEGEDTKALAQTDNDAIDVIIMLFEFILEDKNLPDAMRALLGRLQIPMLKVVLLDKSFLSKKQHPARRLLNKLAQAAFAWSEADDGAGDELYEKMEAVVKRVLSEFDNDLALFEEIDQEFTAFLKKEQHRSEVAEHRAQQISLGKAQFKAARRQVSEEIEARLKDREVPKVVAILLREAWRDVLLLVNLRQGTESKAWSNALALMDKILWSVEPKYGNIERQRMLERIPLILKELREGLVSISYDPCKIARVFKCLQACHVTALRLEQRPGGEGRRDISRLQMGHEDLKIDDDSIEAQGSDEIVLEGLSANEEEAEHSNAEKRGSDEYTEQVESLSVGAWLEIVGESGARRRVKLSWKSIADSSLILVNRRGIKVMEMSVNELATLIQAGRAVVLNELEVPLMDRALSSMVDALRNMEEQYPPKKA